MKKYLKPIAYISMAVLFINTLVPIFTWFFLKIINIFFDTSFIVRFIIKYIGDIYIYSVFLAMLPAEIILIYIYKKNLFENKPINDIIIISVLLGWIPIVFFILAFVIYR